jgi:hypothetical protein
VALYKLIISDIKNNTNVQAGWQYKMPLSPEVEAGPKIFYSFAILL